MPMIVMLKRIVMSEACSSHKFACEQSLAVAMGRRTVAWLHVARRNRLGAPCTKSPEHPIPRHEGLQHVRNERQGVDLFTVGL